MDNKLLWNVLLFIFIIIIIVEYYMSCYERCVCCTGVIEPPNHPGGIEREQRLVGEPIRKH